MDILEDLYYGNLFPHEKCAKLDDEMKDLLGLLNRNEDINAKLKMHKIANSKCTILAHNS